MTDQLYDKKQRAKANTCGDSIPFVTTLQDGKNTDETLSRLAAIIESCDDGIIGLDLNGLITSWNPGAERIYGYSTEEIVGRSAWSFVLAENPENSGRLTERLRKGECVRHSETVGVGKNGSRIDVSISMSPIRNCTGFTGVAMTVRDITDRKRMEDELRRSELKYRSLVEHIPAVTFIGGPDPRDCYISPQVNAMLGYTQKEWFSDPEFFLKQIHPEDRETVVNILNQCSATGQSVSVDHRIYHKDGRILWNSVNLSAVYDDSGNFRYVQGVAFDATERKQAEERLRSSEALLATAQRAAHAGSWQTDLSTHTTKWSDELHRVFGTSPNERPCYESFLKLVHPEDLERVKKELDAARLEGKSFRSDFRIIRPDGAVRVIRSVAEVMVDESGNPTSIVGTDQDVTEAANLEELFRTLVRSSPLGNYIIQDGVFKFVNPQFEKQTGYLEEELLGADPMMLVVAEDRRMVKHNAIRMLRGELATPYEYRVNFRTGATRWIMETVASIQYNGRRAVLGNFMDISERIEAEQTIKQLAYYDSLTGLPNRALFSDRLKLALAHARRYRQKLAVLMLDLDSFKCINDTLGHGAGDRLLQSVAMRLTDSLRKTDTVVRMGGDEFLVLIPQLSSADEVRDVVERITEGLRVPFVLDGNQHEITASIGIALFPDDSQDAESLLKQADVAMYRVKEKGRNGYSYYQQPAA